jgi:ribose transport system permease protein
MYRLLGVVVMVAVLYLTVVGLSPSARTLGSQQTLAAWLGEYGVVTVGVGVLIISGGIDLSIGSLVALGSVCFCKLLVRSVPPGLAALIVIAGSALIGLCHGLLVTKLKLQPFLVTLCGLFIYRGLARLIARQESTGTQVDMSDVRRELPDFWAQAQKDPDLYETAKAQIEGIRLQTEQLRVDLVSGTPLGLPNQFFLLLLVAAVAALLLHGTKYGRYLFAIGANEEAARYAGIRTDRYKILAYVFCSTLTGFAAVQYILNQRTVNPTSAGSLLELYAITGAVLGGCSLRGGEGSVPGMVLGAAVLPLLRQLCGFVIKTDVLEYIVIGSALLLGTIIDELLRRRGSRSVH